MRADLESWLNEIEQRLLPEGPRVLSLDEIGEAIGVDSVGSDDVEALLAHLEAAGATIVGTNDEGLAPLLKKVLLTAHRLKAEGERPSPENIAARSGLSPRAIRVALLYADVLKG